MVFGAHGQIWTAGLSLTKGVLYPWATWAKLFGAGEGNRTLTVSLEGFCSTIELHPLFHLIAPNVIGGGRRIRTFEAFATDLQSAPFDRSGIPPKESDILLLVLFLVKNFFRNLNSALLKLDVLYTILI